MRQVSAMGSGRGEDKSRGAHHPDGSGSTDIDLHPQDESEITPIYPPSVGIASGTAQAGYGLGERIGEAPRGPRARRRRPPLCLDVVAVLNPCTQDGLVCVSRSP